MNKLNRILSFTLLALQLPAAFIWSIVIYTLKADSCKIKETADGAYALAFDSSAFFKALFHEHLSFLALLAVLLALSLLMTKLNKTSALPLIYTLSCVILILLFAGSSNTYALAEYTLLRGALTPPPYSYLKYLILGLQGAVSTVLFVLNMPKSK